MTSGEGLLGAASIARVLGVYRPERQALVELLSGLDDDEWNAATECPAYRVKGIASHLLGDDLSLLSRQRDGAEPGVIEVARERPGADVRTLLDAFNDRWVAASGFLSTDLLVELLGLTGEWTAAYYEGVDPESPGEPVGRFGASGSPSPLWQAIAREYLERWVHHSQIRRALGRGSLADPSFVEAGVLVVAAIAGVESGTPSDDADGHVGSTSWSIGEVVLGDSAQTANILTRGLTAEEVGAVATGPADAVALLARLAGKP